MKRLKNFWNTIKGTNSQVQNTSQSDLPTGSGTLSTTNLKYPQYQMIKQPEWIGRYELTPNFHVYLETKPMWLHRYMTRILLGWKWEDSK